MGEAVGPNFLACQRTLFDMPREVAYLNAAAYAPVADRGARGGG